MGDFRIHCTMNLEIDFQGKFFYGDMLNLLGEKSPRGNNDPINLLHRQGSVSYIKTSKSKCKESF